MWGGWASIKNEIITVKFEVLNGMKVSMLVYWVVT